MSQYNLENTKQMLDFLFAGGYAVKNSLADGKIGFEDIGQLMPVIMKAGPAFTAVDVIPKEIGDLDEQEVAELLTYAEAKFDHLIDDEDLKTKVNKGLKLGVALVDFLVEL